MSTTARSGSTCPCSEDTETTEPTLPPCECPRDEHEIVIHEETCLMYKNEKIIFPHEPETCECQSPRFERGVCECCACLPDQCRCKKAGREAFDEWRKNRPMGAMPAVLESTHPLMQKFQDTLKQFLEKENALAEAEIISLRDELKECKLNYESELEGIYRSDHDTNAQRAMIEEYEAMLAKQTQDRMDAEKRAREVGEKFRQASQELENHTYGEREAMQELEALTTLVNQLEKWREETESDLSISHRMNDKMRAEKKQLADEKRELDMILYGLSNEVWNLESKLELFKKQFDIKNVEMDKINDKVTAYATELEDLELDKRRLIGLWNSVLVNIKQRDNVFDSVREDYRNLQENYRTLMNNLEITKKVTQDEMEKSKELIMFRDKLMYDINAAGKIFEIEDGKREALEATVVQLTDSIQMNEHDQDMIKAENQTLRNILETTDKEYNRRLEKKIKIENEILAHLQECLLNDKAVESMAKGINRMRDMSRKLEIALMKMENQHAKLMLDIEVHRSRQAKNNKVLEKSLEKVRVKEKQLDEMQEKYNQKALVATRKQRELDIVTKKYNQLKEIFNQKSPQERRIEELEAKIKTLRERTESMQHEWLRLQGHVVKLTTQHQKLVYDISLINKQIQICDQKTMYITSQYEGVCQERQKVERILRDLRGRLEVLERTRKEASDRNEHAHRANLAITHEYTANLKTAEINILDLEEEIESLDKEKMNLTQELDRVQREALIWQRKGILAVELKRNIQNAKSAAGEIGQMKNEIHRMEVRREQLRRTSEKMAEDLARYVTCRDTAVEKTRALAAVEKARGSSTSTSQSSYHHKLRLAKADVARVTKDLNEAKAQLDQLQKEYIDLQNKADETSASNTRLEESIATLLRECRETERQKQWLLERVVRSQRLGNELKTAVKRQSIRVKKPKAVVMKEYTMARALNDKLRHIVQTLSREYPYLEDNWAIIHNTLDIYSPTNSPRLTEEGVCEEPQVEEGDGDKEPPCHMPSEEIDENVAEKPLCFDDAF